MARIGHARRRAALRGGIALAALLGGLAGCGPVAADGPREGAVSLLAVGDTGKPPAALDALDPGRAVGGAMAAEDARSAVDAVVLLGDNFYPEGLDRDEVKDRLRENVVGPYCRFIELTTRGAGSLHEACPESEALHPIPLLAVLGNHDYGDPESPELQRRLVPEYVASWHVPEGDFEVRELGGVSLILLDSNRLARGRRGADRAAARAIARSRGPWRVVAAHHPMRAAGNSHDPRFERRMAALLERASVPIHLYLAGHEHNLQAFAGEGSGPALHLVAGGGSDVRELADGAPSRRFASASLGFARIDVRRDPNPALVATLLEVPAPPLPARARAAARFEVALDGSLRAAPDASAVR
jgi:hypothetical protein